MFVENFFPLKRAVSKFEKYCPRWSRPSAWIVTETLNFLTKQVLSRNETLCRGVFFSMKNNINKKGGQQGRIKFLKHTQRKCSEKALGWEPGAHSFRQITTLNPKYITELKWLASLWSNGKQLKGKHSNENLWEKIGNRHIIQQQLSNKKVIFQQ